RDHRRERVGADPRARHRVFAGARCDRRSRAPGASHRGPVLAQAGERARARSPGPRAPRPADHRGCAGGSLEPAHQVAWRAPRDPRVRGRTGGPAAAAVRLRPGSEHRSTRAHGRTTWVAARDLSWQGISVINRADVERAILEEEAMFEQVATLLESRS